MLEIVSGATTAVGFVATTDDQADLAGAKVVASIAREPGAPVKLLKRNTAAGGGDGELVVSVVAAGRIEGTIFLSSAETRALAGRKPSEYALDVVARTATGEEIPFGVKPIAILPRVSAPIA